MAVEKLITDLTKALTEHTVALKENTAAMAAGGAPAAASGGKPAASGGKGRTRTRTAAKGKGKEASPKDTLLEKAGSYLKAPEDRDDQLRLVRTVHPILDKFGVSKVSEVADDDAAEAIELVGKLQAAYDEGGVEGAEAVDLFGDGGGDDGDIL